MLPLLLTVPESWQKNSVAVRGGQAATSGAVRAMRRLRTGGAVVIVAGVVALRTFGSPMAAMANRSTAASMSARLNKTILPTR